MGFDARESTPGFKRHVVLLCAETRSYKRASIVLRRLTGLDASANTLERIALDVGEDLKTAENDKWTSVLQGEVPVPSLAIVALDGGRIRTRQPDHGPGVHLRGKGWSETKNAIFVSATSETNDADPQPDPPPCFLDPDHVAQLTEHAKTKEKQGGDDSLPDEDEESAEETPRDHRGAHKPKRILRTILSSMAGAAEFGVQMRREADRRRFDEADRKAFVADGLTCNWTIRAKQFPDYEPILDFIHAVSYLYSASTACFGKTDRAWTNYARWMTHAWRGRVDRVIDALRKEQNRIGLPPEDADEDDPREIVRRVIGYLVNNRSRMRYDVYRKRGLPTTSAWMESTVKEMNYRIKGTEMFWNDPEGAEAILRIRSASLSDDDRLVRLLTRRPGRAALRRSRTRRPVA